MRRIGAEEGYPATLSAREKIEELLADNEIIASLPEIIGSFTFKPEFDPFKQKSGSEEWQATELILRKGCGDDPSVVLVELIDFMGAAVNNGATEDYLESLFRKTGLKPQQARLRFGKNTGNIKVFETSG